jgi:hypothetical protein
VRNIFNIVFKRANGCSRQYHTSPENILILVHKYTRRILKTLCFAFRVDFGARTSLRKIWRKARSWFAFVFEVHTTYVPVQTMDYASMHDRNARSRIVGHCARGHRISARDALYCIFMIVPSIRSSNNRQSTCSRTSVECIRTQEGGTKRIYICMIS